MKEVDVQIYRARSLRDYEACVELQREVWGYTNDTDITSQPLLMVGNDYGGSVLVAEGAGSRLIGFAFAILGQKADGGLIWWSHMTGIAKDLQGRNIGFRLKQAQRKEALKSGISEIWWTFDPLQAMNAHFNLRKLGAISAEYEENVYGVSSSPLHHGLPTDRLVAEWHLESHRVASRINGQLLPDVKNVSLLPKIIEIQRQQPTFLNLELDQSLILLEIPCDFQALLKEDVHLGQIWQEKIRLACSHYFRQGYAMTDFVLVNDAYSQSFYVFEK